MDETSLPKNNVPISPTTEPAAPASVVVAPETPKSEVPAPISIPPISEQKLKETPNIPAKPTTTPEEFPLPVKNDIPQKPDKKFVPPEISKTLTPTISEEEIDKLKAKNIPISIPKPAPKKDAPEPKMVSISENFATGGTPETKKTEGEKKEAEKDKADIAHASDIPSMRTYKQDVAVAIKDQKTSLVRMVLEERRSRAKREVEESPRSRKNFPIIILSVFFLALTIGVIYFSFFRSEDKNEALLAMNAVPLIAAESSKEFPTDGINSAKLRAQISGEVFTGNIKLDTIEYLFLTKKITRETENGTVNAVTSVSSNEFFSLLGIKLPDMLSRTLNSEFMLGIHSFNGNQPFLILKTDFYETAFAGMLEWERKIPENLLPLFGRENEVEDLSSSQWGDLVVKSTDMRILYYPNKNVAFVYAFKDQKTIIITLDVDTYFKISSRIDVSRGKKIQ